MVCSEEGMYECKDIKEQITVGNGGKAEAIKLGKKKVKYNNSCSIFGASYIIPPATHIKVIHDMIFVTLV